MNIFEPLKKVNKEQWHAKFKLLKEDSGVKGEREILMKWVKGMIDRDHKMVQEFQKTSMLVFLSFIFMHVLKTRYLF